MAPTIAGVAGNGAPRGSPTTAGALLAAVPGDVLTPEAGHAAALSPDGSRLVYRANQKLSLRAMDQMTATPVPGTEAIRKWLDCGVDCGVNCGLY